MSSKLALLLKSKRPAPAPATKHPSEKPSKRRKHQHGSSRQQQGHNQLHQQQQQQQRRHGQQLSNGAATKAAQAADDSEDLDDELQVPADQAYNTLLGLLSKQRGGKGAVLKQHKAQQEGLSDASESESDELSEDGSDSEISHGSEKEQELRRQQQKQLFGRHKQRQQQHADSPEGSDSGEDEQTAAAAGHGSQQQQQQHPGQEEGETDAAADAPSLSLLHGSSNGTATAAVRSMWEEFLSTELSDQQLIALRGGGPLQWQEAGEGQQDPTAGLWKRAKWQFTGRSGFPAAPSQLSSYGVKDRLINRWQEAHQEDAERLASHAAASTSSSSSSKQDGDFVSPQQRALFSLCDSYADVFYAGKPYPGGPGWHPGQPDAAMDAVLLHVLNHCAKTADVIKKNNDKLKGLDAGAVSDVPRDQGFTRPKALLLLPMRNTAYQVVKRLVMLAQKETRADSVQGKEKFVEQFIGDEDQDDLDKANALEAAAAAGQKTKAAPKPAEHRALFHGNLDDHFRLGIRITRGQIKLFADPMQSDIIIASPVGLATKLAEDAAAAAAAAAGSSDGRGKKGGGGKGAAAAGGSSGGSGAADFLSSIEVCVIERADVMLMQNWQHVVTVLEALNQLPKQQHGVNIMRVKLHLLASQGALYRQTIMTSSFASPQLNATFNKHTSSHAGKFRLVSTPTGVLNQVVPQVRQLFERFSCPSASAVPDARFDFFKAQLWPRLAEGAGGGLLLVVPSYFDFVRIRNFLKAEEADITVCSEYSSFPQVTRSRALFFQRRVRLMLYTERAHFYHRYRIRGIQDIVFYGLPDHAHFYAELINLVQTSGSAAAGHHATITTLFCQFDALALARVVGHSRAAKMLTASSSPTFVFC